MDTLKHKREVSDDIVKVFTRTLVYSKIKVFNGPTIFKKIKEGLDSIYKGTSEMKRMGTEMLNEVTESMDDNEEWWEKDHYYMVPLKKEVEPWDTKYTNKSHRVVLGYVNFQLARYGTEHNQEQTEHPEERYEEHYLKEFGKWVRKVEGANEQNG